MHIRQSVGSFSCSSISFVNDGFMLYWATSVKVVFSCVLEIKLQSTRVYMYGIRKKIQKRWITWLELVSDGLREDWTIFLIILFVIIFLFFVGTRGATIAEDCLRLEADWSKSGWTDIITFFIFWWSFAENYIRSSWKKVKWFPSTGRGFWTILLLLTGWAW